MPPTNDTPNVQRDSAKPAGAAETTPISEIMTRAVATVTADLGVDALMSLLIERNISGAPVIDEHGRPIGVVSKTDLLRDRFMRGDSGESGAPTLQRSGIEVKFEGMHVETPNPVSVRDVMTPLAFTLPADASIARASALMALEAVHRVPVVSQTGKVIGILSALDVLRWIARHEGYVLGGGHP